MQVSVFVFVLGVALFAVLYWGFVTLPGEGWQMMATLPVEKLSHGQWKGLNLTWYGALSANAYTLGVVMAVLLASASGIPVPALVMLTLLILAVTIPASRLIARMVEKKRGTLTVGGAVCAGVVVAPWLIILVNHTLGRAMDFEVPVLTMMACLSIGYTFGEGLGRLACLSFGCCYGKPVSSCSPFFRRIFSRFNVVYTGATKKVSYASGLDGQKLVPIQIITATIYTTAGLAGTWLFLFERAGLSLFLTLLTTQVWRVVSEFFRADFRGGKKISWYQIMAVCSVAYAGAASFFCKSSHAALSLDAGLAALWHPGMILFFQGVWLAAFLHAGRSSVTGANIAFHVVRENI